MTDHPSASCAIDVHRLSRTFRGVQALRDVNLQVPTGSVFGLVGLNGAGKTTLIRHLIGSLRALHGGVRVFGLDPVLDATSVLKRVGYLTEEDSLPKWMRVGEFIDFHRSIYPNWDDGYARRLCEMFNLSSATQLRSLSKGQRARVGLLVAIAHRPDLLILDEPSSGLDPIARSDILEAIIRTISDEGRTVLFSSHLLDEVGRVCDTIALMHEGTICEMVDVPSLHDRYVEVICRSEPDNPLPPDWRSAFGWQLSGAEWSAVVERENSRSESEPDDLHVIDRRPVSLDRWFAARTRSPSTAVTP
ncbi:MAG: ABC transporter ATP-binding protein [Pirellulaceae bacterium]